MPFLSPLPPLFLSFPSSSLSVSLWQFLTSLCQSHCFVCQFFVLSALFFFYSCPFFPSCVFVAVDVSTSQNFPFFRPFITILRSMRLIHFDELTVDRFPGFWTEAIDDYTKKCLTHLLYPAVIVLVIWMYDYGSFVFGWWTFIFDNTPGLQNE